MTKTKKRHLVPDAEKFQRAEENRAAAHAKAFAECAAEGPAIKQAYFDKHAGKWSGGDVELREYVDGTTAADRATDDETHEREIIFEAKREAEKVKRLARELKNPAAALARARADREREDMAGDRDDAKADARANGETWGDISEEWAEQWHKENPWTPELEADFVAAFNKTWLAEHGTAFPGIDAAPAPDEAAAPRRGAGDNSNAALAADIGDAVKAYDEAAAACHAINDTFREVHASYTVEIDAASATRDEKQKALGLLLVKAHEVHKSQKAFKAFLATVPNGIAIRRAEELISFATGKKTPEQNRLEKKNRQQKTRDKAKLQKENAKIEAEWLAGLEPQLVPDPVTGEMHAIPDRVYKDLKKHFPERAAAYDRTVFEWAEHATAAPRASGFTIAQEEEFIKLAKMPPGEFEKLIEEERNLTMRMTAPLEAALIRVRDGENEFTAAWDAMGGKTLQRSNPLRQRHEDALREINDAHADLVNILCGRPRDPDHMPEPELLRGA